MSDLTTYEQQLIYETARRLARLKIADDAPPPRHWPYRSWLTLQIQHFLEQIAALPVEE